MIKKLSRPSIALPAFLCAVLFIFFSLLPSRAVGPVAGGAGGTPFLNAVTTKSANFTASFSTDNATFFDVTTGSGTITVTLSSLTGNAGKYIVLRKADAGSGKIVTSPTLSPAAIGITNQGQSVLVTTDGTNAYPVTQMVATMDASGNATLSAPLIFGTDNTYDIGASGANRPRNIFLGGAINTPGTITSGSLSINSQVYCSTAGDGSLNLRVSSTSGSGFSVLSLGGTTSSFPGLKRNGAGFDVRTADDGAYSFADTLYDRHGSGSPEGAVTAPVGASYHRTDGGTSTSLYVKESGSGNTGWVAK